MYITIEVKTINGLSKGGLKKSNVVKKRAAKRGHATVANICISTIFFSYKFPIVTAIFPKYIPHLFIVSS